MVRKKKQRSRNHNQWVQEWQAKRRARGLCTRCGKGKLTINPHTKQPYWMCRPCRVKAAAESLGYYHARRARAASIPPAESKE